MLLLKILGLVVQDTMEYLEDVIFYQGVTPDH